VVRAGNGSGPLRLERAAGTTRGSGGDGVERASDVAELVAHLAAHEDQGDDGEDRDESENECIFGQTLAPLVTTNECDDCCDAGSERHCGYLLSLGLLVPLDEDGGGYGDARFEHAR